MKSLLLYLVDRDLTRYETNKCIRKMITALERGEMVSMCEPSRNIIRVGQELRENIGDSANVIVKNQIIIIEHKCSTKKD